MKKTLTINPIVVYTDGGNCKSNPGPGGYGAVVLRDGKRLFDLTGSYSLSTNNRMEISAVIHALEKLKFMGEKNVVIYSDSQYVIGSIANGWAKRWATKYNFMNKKNEDLWRIILKLLPFFNLEMRWVKGHSGDKWNEYADKLAGEAAYDEENYAEDFGYLAAIGKI
jgi:ribonuclease HI